MNPLPERLAPGHPYPLGATFDGLGINFAVFSAHAERIDLCIFDAAGRREIARYELPEWTDEVWHGYLPDAKPGLLCGYRARGPHAPRADRTFDRRDSAPAVPKSMVTADPFDWRGDVRPKTPWSDTVIYECHVRGLTMLLEEVLPPARGTFAALTHPKVIDHLKRLGVTAVELLPVHAYVQDRILQEKGLANYWGYNTLNFFTPESRYLSGGDQNELRMAVRRLHAEGLEVILDVVFNHTAEGRARGPTLCFRGLDNASYYRLVDDDPRYCGNDTGTGNTLDFSSPRVIQLVADSLRYWATSYGVDGFRFDLGVTLGRERSGFDPGAGFFAVLRQDPLLQGLRLLSDPWDLGAGGCQRAHDANLGELRRERKRRRAEQMFAQHQHLAVAGDLGGLGDLRVRPGAMRQQRLDDVLQAAGNHRLFNVAQAVVEKKDHAVLEAQKKIL